eukprot:TRINITY_DN4235_c0_g1_i12.p1 TRINITY_DN4235_c0_g1~~TRINITY_DN4235_c0_g1_i12.p1  ORF type:complete len:280 (+),score=19.70 TRINITY_DN4235_c0_g1_i12:70-909(+)
MESVSAKNNSEPAGDKSPRRSKKRSCSRSKSRSRSPMRLYIGHLSRHTRESDIRDAFSKYGKIARLDLRSHYAFLEYDDSKTAKEVIGKMHGAEIDRARIIVEEADPRRRHRAPSSRDLCYNCGRKGHWYCFSIKRRARECREGDWSNRCYLCGRRGHVRRNCSASRSRSRSRSRSHGRRKRHSRRSPYKRRRRRSSYSDSDSRSYSGSASDGMSRSSSRSRSGSRSKSRSRSESKGRKQKSIDKKVEKKDEVVKEVKETQAENVVVSDEAPKQDLKYF